MNKTILLLHFTASSIRQSVEEQVPLSDILPSKPREVLSKVVQIRLQFMLFSTKISSILIHNIYDFTQKTY